MKQNRLVYYSTTLLSSFIGGFVAFILLCYLTDFTTKIKLSDAISVANTYIVFTTIIFVGFSVLLAIAGFVFTQQFSISKENQTVYLLNELEKKLKENKDDFGTKFIDNCIKNPDVNRHVNDIFSAKIDQLIREKAENLSKEQSAANALAAKVKDNGDE
jgi:predicted PurR-regulated permease PerM